MTKITRSIKDMLLYVEKIVLIVALLIFGTILALSTFIDMAFLETGRNFSIFFVSGTLFIAGFVHMLLEEYHSKEPRHASLDTESDIGYYLGKMVDSVNTELCTTHIYSITNFTKDKILECAERNDRLKRKIRITRIVGIQSEKDRDCQKNIRNEREA